VWLTLDLALVGLALVAMVVFGVHAYSRFRRMNRFGSRAAGRLSGLADDAGRLGDRLDGLEEHSAALAERSRPGTAAQGSSAQPAH
jgi:hypothetical protein